MSGEGPRVFVVAGEPSGDQLGGRLIEAIAKETGGAARFSGVGGPRMAAAGLESLFPISDIAVMGIGPVLARLATILRRIRETADAAIAARPDVVVLIDSPDFCHRVARRIRAALPGVPIVLYVSPTVWAWRSGRARKIAPLADRLLAILPFEPEVHAILGGPPTVYVGHPILERIDELRPRGGRRSMPTPPGEQPRLLVLPGSRRSEIGRLMPVFGETLRLLRERIGPFEATLPAVEHLEVEIRARVAGWPVPPRVVAGEAAKFEAFRNADAAMAASGTVTLELAAAGVPTVAAYRLDWIGRRVKRFIDVPKRLRGLIRVRSAVLPNLIVGEAAVPELIDETCRPDLLADALGRLLVDGPERAGQLAAFARVERIMHLPGGRSPAEAAADAVLEMVGPGHTKRP